MHNKAQDKSQELLGKLDELNEKSKAFLERETAIREKVSNYCAELEEEVHVMEVRQKKLQDILKNVNNI